MPNGVKTQSSAREAAEAIAVKALEFIAGDPVLFNRFLAPSGLEVAQLRQAASAPGFFAGLLDFVLGHEPTLLAFAKAAEIAPEHVAQAREALGESYRPVPR